MKKTPTEKKRLSWIDIITTFTILSFIFGGSYLLFISKTNNTATSKNIGHAASIPMTVDIIDSNYPGIKINTEISNDPDTSIALQYPQSIDEDFNAEIKEYIKQVKDRYLADITEHERVGDEITGELNISFDTFTHASGMYSFVLESYSNVGGANGQTEIRAFHFNPETSESMTIEDLFEQDIYRLADVSEAVREELYNNPEIKDDLLSEEVNMHTEPSWENFQKFALTDDSLIFYFNEYDIAIGAAGSPAASIPLTKLNHLLAEQFKVLEDNPTPSKRVALTFDDGPEPAITTQILETLKKYNAKATFFMLGSRVEYYPEIAKSVQAAGHELGNHSWNHPNLTKANNEKIKSEIDNTSAIIEEVTGQKATLFRPPYGAFNDIVSAQSDLPIILWSVDTLDWKHRNPTQLLASIKQSTKDGSIILMHDIHQSTADGLDAALAYLQEEGYAFVTVSELNE